MDEGYRKNILPKIVKREEICSAKERKKINYAFINDKLRQNLTKAFNSYQPDLHLRNINHDKDGDIEGKR